MISLVQRWAKMMPMSTIPRRGSRRGKTSRGIHAYAIAMMAARRRDIEMLASERYISRRSEKPSSVRAILAPCFITLNIFLRRRRNMAKAE